MGLCLGFSGLSLVEVIYFYTLRAWCRTRRRKTLWSIMALKLHRLWLRTQGQSDKYNSENQLGGRPRTGSCPSILSDYTDNRNTQSKTLGKFPSRGSEDDVQEVGPHSSQHHGSKTNPFIVSMSKARLGKFPGFGTKYSNS